MVADVDDFTTWVVGKTIAENRAWLRAIIRRETEYESISGSLFEGDKTTFVNSTRNSCWSADEPITVQKEEVRPKPRDKILGAGDEFASEVPRTHRTCCNEGLVGGRDC